MVGDQRQRVVKKIVRPDAGVMKSLTGHSFDQRMSQSQQFTQGVVASVLLPL